MMGKYKLELVTILAVLIFVAAFLIVSSGGAHSFTGSDDQGSAKIAELTGRPAGSFAPIIPQYVPPGSEIESSLFALQASLGGILLGLVFGYWLGQRRTPPGN